MTADALATHPSALQVEQEEEMITNTLQKKLEKVRATVWCMGRGLCVSRVQATAAQWDAQMGTTGTFRDKLQVKQMQMKISNPAP